MNLSFPGWWSQVVRVWSSRRPAFRLGVGMAIVTLALTALLVGRSPDYFYAQALAESGDTAANALQIEHAKSGREIYGNYSRWGFHHPGPMWWYGYAAGELVLRDGLGWVASPGNAHNLVGLVFQLMGWTGTMVGVVRLTGRREALAPAMVIAVIHATLINHDARAAVGLSLWPPHVLLGPFMMMVVLAAGTGMGSRWALPLMVAVGCLLVHGHIAQPLFVGPLALLAMAGWCGVRQRRGEHDGKGPVLVAVGVVLVSVVPFAVDWFGEYPRNVDLIGRYLEHEKLPKSWAQAAVYTFSFFAYTHRQEYWFGEQGMIHAELWREAGLAIGIGVVSVLVLAVLWGRRIWRGWRGATPGDAAEVGWRWLGGLILLGWGLAVHWARTQAGTPFQFNSFFVYGLVLLTYLALLTGLLPAGRRRRGPVPAIVASLVVVGVLGLRPEWRLQTSGAEVDFNANVARVVDPGIRHQLRFEHAEWPKAVQVALALVRMGGTVEVAERWEVMFGRRFGLDVRYAGPRDWLRLSATPIPEAQALPNGLWVARESPPHLALESFDLHFGEGGNARPFLWTGFSHDEPDRVWSDGTVAGMLFTSEPLAHDAVLEWMADPFVYATRPKQRVSVWLDGVCLAELVVAQRGEIRIPVAAELWNQRPAHVLGFHFPDARSPRDTFASDDRRKLGFSFSRLRLAY
ncbi:hypothetical protein [Synoicihabitans lomoniglobus]|uniref:Uncharacterized protein n=1 Tax=Synoicihabitans lomoniglobus TaxID=2909285 RepID=A0AAE9ZY84_9BACT|nr:hypothetical protein [Opitutaceae bacterium LMO-M01]WED65215.1 hypothetical protein PXH66_22990 [Opitutaceae bacterium LMO-M01]